MTPVTYAADIYAEGYLTEIEIAELIIDALEPFYEARRVVLREIDNTPGKLTLLVNTCE